MSLVLSLSDIRKIYGEKEVLRGCAAEFGPGVTALMGPNGSGKSTLLRICALIEEPTAGKIIYREGELPLVHDVSLMRRLTLLLPRAGIFNTSVFRNVSYGLRVRGIQKDDVRERATEILRRVGLHGRERQNALSLSSGEAQRLALARAMVIAPEVIFLDEPTASVDEENREIIEEIISGMKGYGGPTIVLTTHDRGQAERLADGTLVMRKGVIEPA